jgi:2'-5' RNA ligase
MAETAEIPTLSSVQIMLPEAIQRRFERWTKKMPGASWPGWGGHVTLVPSFVPRGSIEEVRAAIAPICAQKKPFPVRVATPVAVQDVTRPGYQAVFLLLEEQGDEPTRLQNLRDALLQALAPLREDLRPELLQQPFMPHVTLALGLGEAEAAAMVQAMRAEPLSAEFMIEIIWLLIKTPTDGGRFDRHAFPLGGVVAAELLRD